MEHLLADPPLKGRPREFDVDKALASALRVFWRDGYDGASMANLTAEMGITKPSLYAAFGNKEALFHKALDLYEREKLAYTVAALEARTARGVAERFMKGALEIQMNACDPKGCFGVISSVTCGTEAASIKADLADRRASSEAALVARFERARAEGELPDGLTPFALTRFLYALLQGMSVQSTAGASDTELEQLVATTMLVWPTR